jgi:hypothetical protein
MISNPTGPTHPVGPVTDESVTALRWGVFCEVGRLATSRSPAGSDKLRTPERRGQLPDAGVDIIAGRSCALALMPAAAGPKPQRPYFSHRPRGPVPKADTGRPANRPRTSNTRPGQRHNHGRPPALAHHARNNQHPARTAPRQRPPSHVGAVSLELTAGPEQGVPVRGGRCAPARAGMGSALRVSYG